MPCSPFFVPNVLLCRELGKRYGVILDWGIGELLPKTTEGFRARLERRVVPHWENGAPKD